MILEPVSGPGADARLRASCAPPRSARARLAHPCARCARVTPPQARIPAPGCPADRRAHQHQRSTHPSNQHPRSNRAHLPTLLQLLLPLLLPGSAAAQKQEVQATLNGIHDAWLAADAAVVGEYQGVDSTLGAAYHAVDVREVWMGTAAPGKLVFKAPRGVVAEPGTEALLMLWDRLSAATDSYLETARVRYGEDAWKRIGPDSLATYLLPFAQYAFPFHKDKLVLRGTSAFPQEVKRGDLHKTLLDLEYSLLPPQLYRRVDAVVHARVSAVDRRSRVIEDTAVEYHIVVDFEVLDVFKGNPLQSLRLDYGSFPRSPRFKENEEVVLFLSRSGEALYLQQGKRAVFHVVQGAVTETSQPLREFVKSLQTKER